MNVPKLRFKEFNNEWEKSSINKLAEINPKNSKIPNKFIYIDLESVSKGMLLKENIVYRESAPSRAQREVKKNDILFQTVRPYQMNNYYVSKLQELPYIASTGYAILRVFDINSLFLYNILHTKKFVDIVLDNCTGTSYPAINSNDLSLIKISYPKNKKEQQKIGTFLSLLDKKIELQSKKIEALKLYKKWLLKKQYYNIKNINNVEISQFAQVYQPITISTANLKNGKYSVFGANGIIGHHDEYNHELEQVTISCRGENSGKINFTPQKCWINGNSMVINIDNSSKITKEYLYYILSSQNLNYLISGSGQPQITKDVVLSHKIPLIEYKKQLHYTIIFKHFDIKINLENNKLFKLELLKKGLMQNMFV